MPIRPLYRCDTHVSMNLSVQVHEEQSLLWAKDLRATVIELRHQLLAWWQMHGRRHPAQKPWMLNQRQEWPAPDEVLNPYPIWVAEVMLQQTQLKVAEPYWRRWIQVFPSLETLAEADDHQVLIQWQGLGYYSRARRLHKGARQLLCALGRHELSGDFSAWPRQLDRWVEIPGVGRTTAGSILSSAFNLPFAILDGNVKRVLSRLIASPVPSNRQLAGLWLLSEELLDACLPRHFNQALMDLGATICKPRDPCCSQCCWQGHCAAYAGGNPVQFPVKEVKKPLPFQVIGVGVVLNQEGEVLIDQRLEEGLLGGLWEFPGGKQEPGEAIEQCIERELREELAIQVEVGELLICVDHAYSHKKLRFVVHCCRWLSGTPKALASQQVKWVKISELDQYPFPAANTRIIEALSAVC